MTRPPTAASATAPTAAPNTVSDARTDTPWLSAPEMTAWRAYVETVGDLTAALERDLAPTGLNLGDYQVLVYLSETEHQQLRMCDLAVRLQLSPSGLTRRLDGLVRAGYVARTGSRHDRRVMLAVLTESGWAALRDAAPVHVRSVRRRIFDHLDHDQVRALGEVFGAIRLGLDVDPDADAD